MKAKKYRLVFWPLFLGLVTLFLSGLESPANAVGVTLFVLMLIYGSDHTRPYSSSVRALATLIALTAAIYWLLEREMILSILALVLLLVVSLVLFHENLSRRFQKGIWGNASH
jgi:hypothetical protein